jgi:uncharacterized repeat protein (TIGR04138 family)
MRSVNGFFKVPILTLGEWTAAQSASTFHLYTHPTPRPYSYFNQLVGDARNYKAWLFWIGGGGLIAYGLYSLSPQFSGGGADGALFRQPWITIILGALLLLVWLRGFLQAVHWTKTAPLRSGVIRELRSIPPWPDLSCVDARQSDGTLVEVTILTAVVTKLLQDHGECEVLYYLRPPPRGGGAETGFGFAARSVPEGWETRPADKPRLGLIPPPEVNFRGMTRVMRRWLEQGAERTGYPFDAVGFVVCALTDASSRSPSPGHEDRRVDEQPRVQHVSGQALCHFIPEFAVGFFRSPVVAYEALSAWGLRNGEDIGTIIMALVEVGCIARRSEDVEDDFRGIDLLVAPLQKRPE